MSVRTATLMKVTPTMPAMRLSTSFAFFAEGSRKDGTPLLTASTPVSAVQPEAKARYDKLIADIRAAYDELTALGIPKEDARYVLANATETKILVTMNARSLLHFFNLRCCLRAQWEIREMANLMLAEVKKVAPALFFNAGASCVNTGRCPEGEMTCGHLAEMLRLREKEEA